MVGRGGRLSAFLLSVGVIVASTVIVNAGTYYSLYGTGDTINTAAEYQFSNKVAIGASSSPNNQLEVSGGTGSAQGARVNTSSAPQFRARSTSYTDRELRFELYNGDGNAYFGTSGLTGSAITSHLVIRTSGDSAANNGEVRIQPGNAQAINATKDAQVAVGVASSSLASSDRLLVNGPIRLTDGGTAPTCSSTYRGLIWHEFGGAGVKDTVQVCAKDASDTYAYRTIY